MTLPTQKLGEPSEADDRATERLGWLTACLASTGLGWLIAREGWAPLIALTAIAALGLGYGLWKASRPFDYPGE